jgi:hypothetical protein
MVNGSGECGESVGQLVTGLAGNCPPVGLRHRRSRSRNDSSWTVDHDGVQPPIVVGHHHQTLRHVTLVAEVVPASPRATEDRLLLIVVPDLTARRFPDSRPRVDASESKELAHDRAGIA